MKARIGIKMVKGFVDSFGCDPVWGLSNSGRR